jgi:hypothetical protein
MTKVSTTTTLESLMGQQQSNGAVGVVDGHEAVILGPVEGGLVEVYFDEAIQMFAPEAMATEIGEPERQARLLRDTLLLVNQRRRDTQREFREVLGRIRDYAIARHQEGEFCEDGLNAFLREFDLAEYYSDEDEDEG